MSLNKLTVLVASLTVLTAASLAAAVLYRVGPFMDKPERDRPDRGSVDKSSESADKQRIKEVTPEIRAVVKSNSDFAFELYGRLARKNPGGNLFFSPYSVASALAMVAEGARGETAEEMGKVLRYAESARQKGDEARTLPWDMARIHGALAALNGHFTIGNKSAPARIRERLETLRKELADSNQQANELARKGDFRGQGNAARKAQQLAAEINKLQTQYAQYELRIANALWGEKSYAFKQSYFDALDKHYHTGGFFPVDFRNDFEGARKRINAWVEEQTRNRIKDMLPPDVLDEESKKLVRLILTNAIYFKGEWVEVFQEAQTKDDDFLLVGGKKERVPMMYHDYMQSVRYAAFRGDGSYFDTPHQVPRGEIDPKKVYPDERGFVMLELPYKGDELSMVLFVPRSADGLTALEKNLTSANVATWIGKLQQRAVHVFVPRFKLETKYAMEQTLSDMGMVRAFVPPSAANGAQFDGMSESSDPSEKLYISKVLHKAFVEVNEKGTEAAAATAVIMVKEAAAPIELVPFTPTFKADRSFVFLIRDRKTGSILFLGRMMQPQPMKSTKERTLIMNGDLVEAIVLIRKQLESLD
jgi:serine protease inhibitor